MEPCAVEGATAMNAYYNYGNGGPWYPITGYVVSITGRPLGAITS